MMSRVGARGPSLIGEALSLNGRLLLDDVFFPDRFLFPLRATGNAQLAPALIAASVGTGSIGSTTF